MTSLKSYGHGGAGPWKHLGDIDFNVKEMIYGMIE